MIRIFLLKIKTILKNRSQVFWVMIFPLLLGTLFYFTFGTLLFEDAKTEPIPVIAVKEGDNPYFINMLEALSEGEDRLIDLKYADYDDALEYLKDDTDAGVFIVKEKPELIVASNGIDQTILSALSDRYAATESTVKNIVETTGNADPEQLEKVSEGLDFIKPLNLNVTENSMWRENFYALIAMTCLYGSFFGLITANELQPSKSGVGLRQSVSAVPKSRLVLSGCAATTLTVFVIVLILIFYLTVILKIHITDDTPSMILTSFAGTFCGVMLGMLVGTLLKFSNKNKEALLTSLILTLCFLSGLMYPGMRLLIEHSAPVINRINPAALIADSFYALNAYGAGERFYMDTILLFAIGGVFGLASVLALRRNRYAGI